MLYQIGLEFMTPISLSPEKVKAITLASCVLHSYLWSHNIAQSVYMPPHSIDMEDTVTHEVQLYKTSAT